MTWRLGWYPWDDPVSSQQERTEAMLEREYPELFGRTQQETRSEKDQEETDDANGA